MNRKLGITERKKSKLKRGENKRKLKEARKTGLKDKTNKMKMKKKK